MFPRLVAVCLLLLMRFTPGVVPVTLAVMRFAPRFNDVQGYEGETAILTCVVLDKDEYKPIYWSRYVDVGNGRDSLLSVLSKDRDADSYRHAPYNVRIASRLAVVGDETNGEYHLLIEDLNLEDSGRFVAFFVNAGGYSVYANETYLNVLPRQPNPVTVRRGVNPVCQATVSSPVGQTVSVGTQIAFVCDASNRQDITALTWYVGSGVAKSCPALGTSVRICSLERTLALRDVGVEFRCAAAVVGSRQQGTRSEHLGCSLTPLVERVTVQVSPSTARVTAGESASFSCSIRGDAALGWTVRYAWFMNQQRLRSTSDSLEVSSTAQYSHDNTISCVITDYFDYMGHDTAILTVQSYQPDTSPSTVTTDSKRMEDRLITSTNGATTYPSNSSEIGDILLLAISEPSVSPMQPTMFPLLIVIFLASATLFMAFLLAVIIVCLVSRNKRRRAGARTGRNAVPDTPSPPPSSHPGQSGGMRKIGTESSTLPPGNDDSTAYVVLDRDRVDNDSLSSLELNDMLHKNSLETAHKDHRPNLLPSPVHEGGNPARTPRQGRSFSTPAGPVVVYAGKMMNKVEGNAVAYAVTDLIQPRIKWDEHYDKISTRAETSGLSRKRAMSSPMTGSPVANRDDRTAGGKVKASHTGSSMRPPRVVEDDHFAYAEVCVLPPAEADQDDSDDDTVKLGPPNGTVSDLQMPHSSYPGSENAYAITKIGVLPKH